MMILYHEETASEIQFDCVYWEMSDMAWLFWFDPAAASELDPTHSYHHEI